MSEYFRGVFAEEQLGVRTERLPEVVLKELPNIAIAERDGLLALLTSLGKKGAKGVAEDDGDDKGAEQPSQDSGAGADGAPDAVARTAHLLFLSRQEVELVVSFANEQRKALAGLIKKGRADPEALKKLRVALRDYLEKNTSGNAVDIGLFGRFITSDEFDTVDGALQVAHGIGTQKVEVEYDYFTAVDDLSRETGAGHLGESEFASSVLYLYACCDLDQLERNLGARGERGRVRDAEAVKLAKKSLPALVRAVAEATPKGKKNGTAPYTPAEYIELVVRRGSPLSLANAFAKPVDAKEQGGDAMAASVARLTDYRKRIEVAYDREGDLVGRHIFRLPSKESEANIVSIKALSDALKATLDTLKS